MQFIDLKAQQDRIRNNINSAITKVLDSGAYIMGKEVFQMEAELSEFCGAKHTLSCSSGTDALLLPLMAWNVGHGDAVFVPSFTFTATAEVVMLLGATPIFIDVKEDTFNMCADSLQSGVRLAKNRGLNPKVIIGVDLFGQPAEWDALLPIAREHSMKTLDDAAQGFGGVYKGRKIGTIADATATSFFPAKPLGCYGDGGAVFTDDTDLNDIMISLRIHGQDNGDKYKNSRIGLNARMDTIQCAILSEKLKIFKEELELRNVVANRYSQALSDVVQVPYLLPDTISAWAQYTILLDEGADRSKIQKNLQEAGVPSAVYYPIAMHKQEAYLSGIKASDSMPVSESLCERVLALPMHPYLSQDDQNKVMVVLKKALSV